MGILLSRLRLSDGVPSRGAESLGGGRPGLAGIVSGIVSHSGLLNVPLVHLFASFALTGKEVFIEESLQTLMAMRAVEGVVVGLIFLPRADVVESCLAFFASLPEEAAVEAFKLRSVYRQWYSFALRHRHPSLFWQRLEVVKYISETFFGTELDNGLRQAREGSYEKGPWPDAASMAIDATAYHMSFIDLYCMGLHRAMVSGDASGGAQGDQVELQCLRRASHCHPLVQFVGTNDFAAGLDRLCTEHLTVPTEKYAKCQRRVVEMTLRLS